MVGKNSLCAVLCVCTLTLAATVVEKVHLPQGWKVAQKPNDKRLISLQISLQQRNLDKMIEELYTVSDPDSKRYGQHYSYTEALDLVRPSDEANDMVLSWLRGEIGAGISNVRSDGHYVTFTSTIGAANRILNTQFLLYEHMEGTKALRTTEYSVPDDLAKHIDIITPTTYFSRAKTGASIPSAGLPKSDESCSTSFTPKCYRDIYNVGDYIPDKDSGSSVAISAFLNQSAQRTDLFKFERHFKIPRQGFKVELINGGTDNQDAPFDDVFEADLDIENLVGMSHPLPITEYITGGLPPFHPDVVEPTKADESNEPYLQYYKYLLSKPSEDIPAVISNSYTDDEQTVPYKYAKRVCNMIAIMGMRGHTIFECSGDTGVGAGCKSNDAAHNPVYTPQFPGTCPYVTAVGGTQGYSAEAPYEIAWTNGTGGFSNYFSAPTYQVPTISNYFHNYVSKNTQEYSAPYYNRHGRGVPDVSAHSFLDYKIVYKGTFYPSGGTSAASPLWAGIIGMLNDARLKHGHSVLGYLNPFLYKYGHTALNDIVEGGSIGCIGVYALTGASLPGSKIIPYASWNATIGWDPVTGLGTPNFQKLKAMVLSLPG